MKYTPRVKQGLLRHRLDDQVLVYDSNADQVHLLDSTTAHVLELLDAGNSADSVAKEFTQKLGSDSSDELVALSFDELRKARLLDETDGDIEPLADLSRRNFLRKAGIAAAAGIAIPVIVTMTANSGYAQGCATSGQACGGSDPVCCTGLTCVNLGSGNKRCQ